ncbi:hypothetical protein GGQ88_001563 [Novosphingobium hassiacum]|uniref:Uncharacterized protein n=1 Tax=Novosphingobium hassiacum TaxID=173676 RepID=A0A7W6EVG3_9SPHN|nr:hypothetical protein [Novosphingobium hassiacum]MBB3860297.1 hypothetical protein [Novosphingobium hassiacum]
MHITKALRFALLPCACAIAGPAIAQTAVSQERVTAGDVATTPLSDLNIKKDEVPALLVSARDKPYDVSGLKRCPAIASEIGKLDAVLGDDIDIARDDDKGGPKVGNMAKSLVSSLIPFGGVIREISGANAQQRKWNEAIYAGSVRRAFLKGVGEQRGCKYPARSATAKDSATLWAARDAAEASEKAKDDNDKSKDGDKKKVAAKDAKGKPVKFESKTVVQPTN